jgi:hypothetical protein
MNPQLHFEMMQVREAELARSAELRRMGRSVRPRRSAKPRSAGRLVWNFARARLALRHA